jgi:hypothetical protein
MWTKLPDEFYDDPALDRAGAAATGVYVRQLAYCSRHLTDGYVPHRAAKFLAWDDLSLIDPLVREGLVERQDDGYFLPRYLHHNPNKATVTRDREKARERAAKARERSKRAPDRAPHVLDGTGRAGTGQVGEGSERHTALGAEVDRG